MRAAIFGAAGRFGRRPARHSRASVSTITSGATRHVTTSGIAPVYAHFDASTSTSTETSNPYRDIIRVWDFGDTEASGTGAWDTGTRAGVAGGRNTAQGPIAGHIYEHAGTFTPVCYEYDGVSLEITTLPSITVTAQDDAAALAGNKTVVWDPSGAFASMTIPTGAQTSSAATYALMKAGLSPAIGQTGHRILFAAGQTFDMGTFAVLSVQGPVRWGRIGVGADPKLQTDAGGTSTYILRLGFVTNPLSVNGYTKDYAFTDLVFDGSNRPEPKTSPHSGLYLLDGVDEVTQLRCTFDTLLAANSKTHNQLSTNNRDVASKQGHHVWRYWAMQDCEVVNAPNAANDNDSANKAYNIYASDEYAYYAGNSFDNRSNLYGTHIFRQQAIVKTAIVDNDIKNPGRQSAGPGAPAITIHGARLDARDDQVLVDGPGAGATRWNYVGRNFIDGGTYSNVLVSMHTQGSIYGAVNATVTGSIPDNSVITGATSGASGTVLYLNASNQIIYRTPVGGSFQIGETLNIAGSPVATVNSLVAIGQMHDDESQQDALIEDNWFRSATDTQYMVDSSTYNLTLRNNIYDMTTLAIGKTHGFLNIKEPTQTPTRPYSDSVHFDHNSIYGGALSGSNMQLVRNDHPGATDILGRNNLAYAPNMTSSSWISTAGVGQPQITISNSTGDVGGFTTNPFAVGGDFTTVAGYELNPAGYAKSAATVIDGALRDFDGDTRSGTPSMGAKE